MRLAKVGKNVTVTEPILVIAFNRPDHLSVLFDRLREVKPTKIYFAVDGPRDTKPGERESVQDCRDMAKSVDWPCTVVTNFQDKNLGCGLGVSTAITWFFQNEERGIILEDDIIPDPSFFPFCSELLDRYANDPQVFAISGCNFVPREHMTSTGAYRFSQVPHIWGWASWRDRWALYQFDMNGWRKELPVQQLWSKSGRSIPATVFWAGTFELLAHKEVDTWDGQLVHMCMKKGMVTANCNTNLVKNIGFNEQATHTKKDLGDLLPVIPVVLPTATVPVKVDRKADSWTRTHHFRATWRGMLYQGFTFLKRQRATRSSERDS